MKSFFFLASTTVISLTCFEICPIVCADAVLNATTTTTLITYRPRSTALLRNRKLVDSEAMSLWPPKAKGNRMATKQEDDKDKHRALVEEWIFKNAGGSANHDKFLRTGSFSMMSHGEASFSFSFPQPESMLSFSFPPAESMLSFSFPHVMCEFFMSFPSSVSFPPPTMDKFLSFPTYNGGTELSFSYPKWPVETEYSFSFPASPMSFLLAKLDAETEPESTDTAGFGWKWHCYRWRGKQGICCHL